MLYFARSRMRLFRLGFFAYPRKNISSSGSIFAARLDFQAETHSRPLPGDRRRVTNEVLSVVAEHPTAAGPVSDHLGADWGHLGPLIEHVHHPSRIGRVCRSRSLDFAAVDLRGVRRVERRPAIVG